MKVWARLFQTNEPALANVSIKFQTLLSDIRQYICRKKCEKLAVQKLLSVFFNKNISVYAYKFVKLLTN